MSLLDKIIYMADMTSDERDFPGVEELRKLEFEDLDLALCTALEHSLQFVNDGGKPVDTESIAALEDVRETIMHRT